MKQATLKLELLAEVVLVKLYPLTDSERKVAYPHLMTNWSLCEFTVLHLTSPKLSSELQHTETVSNHPGNMLLYCWGLQAALQDSWVIPCTANQKIAKFLGVGWRFGLIVYLLLGCLLPYDGNWLNLSILYKAMFWKLVNSEVMSVSWCCRSVAFL